MTQHEIDGSIISYTLKGQLIRAALHLLAFLPLRLAHALGRMLGEALWLTPNTPRHVALTNIKLCFPKMSKQQIRNLAHQSLIETGRTYAEMGALWLWPGHKILAKIQKISGENCITEAMAAGKGVLLVAPHFGCWEIVNLYLSSCYPMTALYKPPKLADLEMLIKHGRERLGGQMASTRSSGLKTLFKALKQSRIVGVLPDQDPGRKGGMGEFAPFFGVPANTMVLLSRLAQRSSAAVVFAAATRLQHGLGYQLTFQNAPMHIDSKDLKLSITAVNQGVENCVKLAPAQYQWNYKRFKSRPEGQSKVY